VQESGGKILPRDPKQVELAEHKYNIKGVCRGTTSQNKHTENRIREHAPLNKQNKPIQHTSQTIQIAKGTGSLSKTAEQAISLSTGLSH
jgi:hypothetical protein